jgi:hypothetical protein
MLNATVALNNGVKMPILGCMYITYSLQYKPSRNYTYNIRTQSHNHATTHATTQACKHAIMQSCNHAIMQSCNHAIMQSCNHAIMQLCNYAIMQSRNHAITQSRNHAITQSRKHAITQTRNQSQSSHIRPIYPQSHTSASLFFLLTSFQMVLTC